MLAEADTAITLMDFDSYSLMLDPQFLLKPEMLLTRLVLERPALQLRLTRLLLPLYLPQGRSAQHQLARLIALVKEHPQVIPSVHLISCLQCTLPQIHSLVSQAAALMLRHAPCFSNPVALVKVLIFLLWTTLSNATPAELTIAKGFSDLTERLTPIPSDELTALFGNTAELLDALGPSLNSATNSAAYTSLVSCLPMPLLYC